ncbi:predicted protein [Botrytis cinerea T4]|uniref:Uncharacterized protein n=1 Tax=Botryotinia fuckeliana (strain T4) TaxID=999810 RepID=G2YG48_BOTF4|nr:predicted protein [Botrytis cinerea T4]
MSQRFRKLQYAKYKIQTEKLKTSSCPQFVDSTRHHERSN